MSSLDEKCAKVLAELGLTPGPKLFAALYRQARQGRRTRIDLPSTLFSTIYSDCNWSYEQFGQRSHGAQRAQYDGSAFGFLSQIPVWEWGKPSSNLLHWVTSPKIEEGIAVMQSWGYHVVTTIPWVKTVPHKGVIKRGVGCWGYSASEYLLVCRKGSAKAPSYKSGADKPFLLLAGPRSNPCFYDPSLHEWLSDPDVTEETAPVFYAKIGGHSRKPLSLFEWIEAYLPGRYLEIFARGSRANWTCIGHETGWHLCEEGPIPYAEAVERKLILPDEDEEKERARAWSQSQR